MLNRRDLLLASIAAGVAIQNRNALAKAAQPATTVNFDVPAHACDCHTHVHGDVETFPFFAGRVYTPGPASPEEMAALHRALHVERVVIVTPSVYGTDNSSSLFGIKARGATARGVAVIDDNTTEAQLDTLHAGGFRGIRINMAAVERIKDLVLASPVPAVFDHFGGLEAPLGLEQPGFADLIALVKSGKAY